MVFSKYIHYVTFKEIQLWLEDNVGWAVDYSAQQGYIKGIGWSMTYSITSGYIEAQIEFENPHKETLFSLRWSEYLDDSSVHLH